MGVKMNDIKSYVIGFLSCLSLFLIMGQAENTVTGTLWHESDETIEWNVNGKVIVEASNNGRYQGVGIGDVNTCYMIDTSTGNLYSRIAFDDEWIIKVDTKEHPIIINP